MKVTIIPNTRLKARIDARATELSLGRLKTQNNKRQQLLNNASHYWSEDSLPFAYAIACAQIVLLHGKADQQYQEAKEAWALPDCQLAMQDFRTAYLDKAETLQGWPCLWKEQDKFTNSKDFETLIERCNEFIKVGFNRKIDQDNKEWKVVASDNSIMLLKAITLWTLADYLGIKLDDWNKYKPLVCDGKTYDTEEIMTNKPTHRVHRQVVSLFKRYGKLIHDKKLLKDADTWYNCRVLPGSIEIYLNERAKQGATLERSRVENDIVPCDEVTGYPRKWRD